MKPPLVNNIGGHHVSVIVADFNDEQTITPQTLSAIGYQYDSVLDKWHIGDMATDYIYSGKNKIDFKLPGTLSVILDYAEWQNYDLEERTYPLFTTEKYLSAEKKSEQINFVAFDLYDITEELLEQLQNDKTAVIVLETDTFNGMIEQRRAFFELLNDHVKNPVIIRRNYDNLNPDELRLYSSTDIGSLLLDGFGDGVWLNAANQLTNVLNQLSFGILQGTRRRISKTEYISCPSCGRTLFDLQETTAKIRSQTNHLKGVKIAIMGCIVNGPR